MKRVGLVSVMLCLVTAFWVTGCAGKTTIAGVVTYSDGSPAVGKTVVAVEIDGYRSLDAQTDATGRYVLEGASQGQWQIYVLEGDAWSDDTPTHTLHVWGGQENVLDIPWPY